MKILIAALIFPHIAEAAFSNYNSILIGDQVAGMGGAGTAIIGDVAASPYYNPATLGMLEDSAFSASVGIYKKFDTVYEQEEDITKAPMRVSQGYFRSLPSSVGSAIKVKDWIMALSVVVPDFDYFKGDLYNKGPNVTTLSFTDESLWVGAAAGKKISEKEAVGLTVYYTARNYNRSLDDKTSVGTTETKIFSSERTKQDNTIVAILGYYRKLDEKWGMGLGFRPRSFLISSKMSVFETTTSVDIGGPTLNQQTVNEAAQDSSAVIPGRLNWGLTFTPDAEWLFAGDISFHESVSYEESANTNTSSFIDHKATWNFQIGAQWKLRDWLKIRSGFFTDLSSHPDPVKTNRIQQDRVDMYGFSANFDFIAGNKIGYTFGGYYTGGKGISLQRRRHEYEIVTKNQHIFTMLMGSSFHF